MRQDKVLEVLRPRESAKRASGRVIRIYVESGRYTVQVDGRVVASAAGDIAAARVVARDKKVTLKRLTKRDYTIEEYS